MAEIAEAVQIVEVLGRGVGGTFNMAFKTGEYGVKIIKAIMAHIEKEKAKNLSGKVSLEDMTRYEGNNLGMCRFEGVSKEEIYKVLDEFDIPYTEMPDAEINGTTYTQIAFGKSYTDRMAAAIQTLGHGEIINASTSSIYITSGEVSLDVLQEQDGMQLMYARFPDASREQIIEALNAYGIKYATLPDLNLNDGNFEIAFPPSQQTAMAAMMEKIKLGSIINFSDYTDNADPKRVDALAAEYDKLHVSMDNTKVISTTEKEMVIEIPEENLIMRDPGELPLIAVNSAYAVPVPLNDISTPDEKGNIKVTLHTDMDYTPVLPTGKNAEKKKGKDVISELMVTLNRVLNAPPEQTNPTAAYANPISFNNTKLVQFTEDRTIISVPADSLIKQDGKDPMLAINSNYAIPIPQEDISKPDERGNVQIMLHPKQNYTPIMPNGEASAKKKGRDLISDIMKTLDNGRKKHNRTRAV